MPPVRPLYLGTTQSATPLVCSRAPVRCVRCVQVSRQVGALDRSPPRPAVLHPIHHALSRPAAGLTSGRPPRSACCHPPAAGRPPQRTARAIYIHMGDDAGAQTGAVVHARRAESTGTNCNFTCCGCQRAQKAQYSTFKKWSQMHILQLGVPELRAGATLKYHLDALRNRGREDAGGLLCPKCLVAKTATAGEGKGKKCLTYNSFWAGQKSAPLAKFTQKLLDGSDGEVDGRVGEPAWDVVTKWFDDAELVAGLRNSGAMAVLQKEGDTFFLPPGYGHFVASIAGEEYLVSRTSNSQPEKRRLCISVPAWHTPKVSRRLQLAGLPQVAFGEHSEAQMSDAQWPNSRGLEVAATKILQKYTQGASARATAKEEFIDNPDTPALVSVDAKPGEGHCLKITSEVLASIALGHGGPVWNVSSHQYRESLDIPGNMAPSYTAAADAHMRALRGVACDLEQVAYAKLVSKHLGGHLNHEAAISMFEAVAAPDPAVAATADTHTDGMSTRSKSVHGRADFVLKRSTKKHAHMQGVLNTLLVGKKFWLVWEPGKSGPSKACIRKSGPGKERSPEPRILITLNFLVLRRF